MDHAAKAILAIDPQRSVRSEWVNGRDGKIRTCDLRYPKPSRYQAALRPDLRGPKAVLRKTKPLIGKDRKLLADAPLLRVTSPYSSVSKERVAQL